MEALDIETVLSKVEELYDAETAQRVRDRLPELGQSPEADDIDHLIWECQWEVSGALEHLGDKASNSKLVLVQN